MNAGAPPPPTGADLIIRRARVVTLADGPVPRRGPRLRELGVLPDHDVLVRDGLIERVGPGLAAPPHAAEVEARGRVLTPGLIDAHTHACWAGDRLDEWDQKRAGASYLDILARGGGIMSTVRAVRNATQDELTRSLLARLRVMLAEGSTTLEVKSGYGLSTDAELKMLRAVRAAASAFPGTLVPTALLGHAIDPAEPGFVDRVIADTLPAVHAEFPGVAVDAYVERGAWSPDDAERLFRAAAGLGHPIRVHADQFTSLGMVARAVALGARSVDHLEATTPDDRRVLAGSPTAAVVLPVCGLHLGARSAPGAVADARALADDGAALVLATNDNPGSAPCPSLALAMALGVRWGGLSPAEALAACTVNAAWLLGFSDRGRIAPGLRADLALWRHTDERAIAYDLAGRGPDLVICSGVAVAGGGA